MKEERYRDNLKVGPPAVDPSASSHVAGVREGNQLGSYAKMAGHLSDGRSTAERSTGIGAKHENPIDPKMPNLSPA